MTAEPLEPPTSRTADAEAGMSPIPDGWRSVVLITWLLVFGAMTAVAISSRTIGRSIWWLGPSVDPAPLIAVAIPAAICLTPLVVVMRRPASSASTGIVCAVLLAVTALPDVNSSPGVAVAVAGVAFAALLSSGAFAIATRHYR